MMEELTLWDIGDGEPAPMLTTLPSEKHGTSTGYRYGCRCRRCREAHIESKRLSMQGLRKCKHCGRIYSKDADEGGTKFCAECIANGVYQRHQLGMKRSYTCIRCTADFRDGNMRLGKGVRKYPLCGSCVIHPYARVIMSSAAKHSMPAAMLVAVIDWPYCANEQCGAYLFGRVFAKREDKYSSRHVYNFAVDHDHACCPGDYSCGRCVRGIVCRRCNHSLIDGSDALTFRGLADYLT